MNVSPEQIVDEARAFLGVRFRNQGRSRREGVDCLGLLVVVAKSAGIDTGYRDLRDYGVVVDSVRLLRGLRTHLTPVSWTQRRKGDVILFAAGGSRQHLGIYAGANRVIHASYHHKRVVEHRIDPDWGGRVRGVFRWVSPATKLGGA